MFFYEFCYIWTSIWFDCLFIGKIWSNKGGFWESWQWSFNPQFRKILRIQINVKLIKKIYLNQSQISNILSVDPASLISTSFRCFFSLSFTTRMKLFQRLLIFTIYWQNAKKRKQNTIELHRYGLYLSIWLEYPRHSLNRCDSNHLAFRPFLSIVLDVDYKLKSSKRWN